MTMDTRRAVPDGFRIGGVFHFSQIRDGEVLDEWDAPNLITNQGLNHALGVVLAAGTQATSWYVMLKDNTGDPLDGAETYGTQVFTEITAYDEATRPAWNPATVSGQSVANSATVASFTINASTTVYGAALADSNVISGATAGHYLFCAANFASAKALVSGDTLEVTYTLTAATST